MSEWVERRLSEIGTVERGRSRHRPRNDPRLYGDIMPFFQTGDVKAATLHLERPQQWYSEFGVKQSRVWEPGITCITIAANIADTAVLRMSGCFPDSVLGFTPAEQVEDAYFVKYLLDAYREQLGNAARGTTQDNLSLEKLLSFRFPMPSAKDRRTIVVALRSFDDLIENNRRRIEILEQMARSIYREWFVKFRYPGHENVPLVDSELGPMPEGWTTPRLSQLVSTQYGFTESATKTPLGPKYLRGMDINKTSFIDWSAVPYCPVDETDVERFRIRLGDVFVIRMADPGKVGICETEVDAVFASYLVRLRPSTEELRPYFLFFTLIDSEYQNWISGVSTGATRKSVSAKVMTEPRIILPSVKVQKEFESVVTPIRETLTTFIQQNAKLVELRDLLLPKLVTGEIDVSSLDLDALIEEQVA